MSDSGAGGAVRAGSRVRVAIGSGLFSVGISTAIAGIIGYVITWLVPRKVGFDTYTDFASFWAFAFLSIAALSGIQQEVTRATNARIGRRGNGSVWAFAVVVSLGAIIVILATAGIWVDAAFPRQGWSMVWPLALGIGSYVFIGAMTGTLYGLQRWHLIFFIVVCEALTRLAAVVGATSFTSDVTLLAWAVVAPFPVTVIAMVLIARTPLFSVAGIDVSLRRLTSNVARTVSASASMGLIISGFPLLLTLTSKEESREILAVVILTSTLVRAPLIVTAMAFQSYLIVLFRTRADQFWKIFLALQAGIVALGVVLAAVGLVAGPSVFAFLFPGEPAPSGWLVASLIASSALVGSLCISAPAVLSRSAHTVFTAGWLAAAIATMLLLLVPADLEVRTVLALSVGPIVGSFIHLVYLARSRSRHSEEHSDGDSPLPGDSTAYGSPAA